MDTGGGDPPKYTPGLVLFIENRINLIWRSCFKKKKGMYCGFTLGKKMD